MVEGLTCIEDSCLSNVAFLQFFALQFLKVPRAPPGAQVAGWSSGSSSGS